MPIESKTVTKVFCALTEPEIWAQIRKYEAEKPATMVEYLMDVKTNARAVENQQGIPANYNATVVFALKS